MSEICYAASEFYTLGVRPTVVCRPASTDDMRRRVGRVEPRMITDTPATGRVGIPASIRSSVRAGRFMLGIEQRTPEAVMVEGGRDGRVVGAPLTRGNKAHPPQSSRSARRWKCGECKRTWDHQDPKCRYCDRPREEVEVDG